MATIKSYTDLEQSKKLAEILPLESADMIWKKELKYRICSGEHKVSESDFIYCPTFKEEQIIMSNFDVPAWSLAALLGVLPKPDLVQNSEGTWLIHSWVNAYPWSVGGYSNPVDACYEMIIRLNELNLL